MTLANMIRALLKEPLVQFGVLGLALFLVMSKPSSGERDFNAMPIRVDATLLSALQTEFQARQQRAPDAEELDSLVRNYIEEEALVREARKLGLDQDDIIIRRRLVQKMQFMFQDLREEAPVDSYRDFYQAHSDNYVQPATLSFEQRFFGREPPTSAQFDPDRPDQAFSLGHEFVKASEPKIEKWFGTGFYQKVSTLPEHQWQGPIASAYGFHFVRVLHHATAKQLPFEAVADAVRQDYWQAQRISKREEGIARIVERQPVQWESPIEQDASL